VPHYLPRSLATSHPGPEKKRVSNKPEPRLERDHAEVEVTGEGAAGDIQMEGVNNDRENTNSETFEDAKETGGRNQLDKHDMTRSQRSYTLLSHTFIGELTRVPKKNESNRYIRGYTRFSPDAYHSTRQWRTDMADWVLELRRRRIVALICHLFSCRKGYLVPCGRHGKSAWDDAKQKHQVAALLWVGKETEVLASEAPTSMWAENQGSDLSGSDSSLPVQEESRPSEFATLLMGSDMQKKAKIPVHSLPDLLGEEKISEIRSIYPTLCDGELIVVKNKVLTKDLQMHLWALQGYLAKHEDASAPEEDPDFDDFEEEEFE